MTQLLPTGAYIMRSGTLATALVVEQGPCPVIRVTDMYHVCRLGSADTEITVQNSAVLTRVGPLHHECRAHANCSSGPEQGLHEAGRGHD